MPMNKDQVRAAVGDLLFPAFSKEREHLNRIDRWMRWDHEDPHSPRHATMEYKELSARAQTPWLGLVVSSVVQALYVDGYRSSGAADDAAPWGHWQANGMDRRQIALHRAAVGYGISYTTILPGTDPMFGEPMPVIGCHSPRRFTALYDEPETDEWPHFAMRADPAMVEVPGAARKVKGWALRVYDDTSVYYLHVPAEGGSVTYIEDRQHDLGFTPAVRYSNQLDLEGRSDGEVEPFIPVAGRIDQTVFDRLVVQRFASWKVRTIAGMAKPDGDEDAAAERLRLKVEDLLVAEDADTKFGTLPETSLNPFIDAAKADIEALAAVSQTPAHELLGSVANLSAEALAAARASLTAKIEERQTSLGESHEQTLRACAFVMGDTEAARDISAQVRWRDTEIRSLAQAADALGKLAQMLGVPVELLWEKIPGFSDQDVERAKALVEQGGGLEALMRELAAGQISPADDEPVLA